MSDPITLFTKRLVTEGALIDQIVRIGGIRTEGPFCGRISQGHLHLWIGLDSTVIEDMKLDFPETFALVTKLLGGFPTSSIVIEHSDEPETEALLIKFIVSCADIWPIVIYDNHDDVFLPEELLIHKKNLNV